MQINEPSLTAEHQAIIVHFSVSNLGQSNVRHDTQCSPVSVAELQLGC